LFKRKVPVGEGEGLSLFLKEKADLRPIGGGGDELCLSHKKKRGPLRKWGFAAAH